LPCAANFRVFGVGQLDLDRVEPRRSDYFDLGGMLIPAFFVVRGGGAGGRDSVTYRHAARGARCILGAMNRATVANVSVSYTATCWGFENATRARGFAKVGGE